MADAEIRPLRNDASIEDIIGGVNTALGILRGDIPGHFSLIGSDGVSRNIRGGAVLSTGNYTLKIRSDSGNHLDIRNAADTASQLNVTDANGVTIGATVLHLLTASSRIKGIFSGAVPASKTLFLTDATNSETIVGAIPSGSGTTAGWVGYNNSAPGSATGAALLQATSTAVELKAENPSGAGALPMDFYTNATKQASLSTTGVLSLLSARLQVSGGTVPAAGAGVEVGFAAGVGTIVAFDRTGGTYQALNLDASTLGLQAGGVTRLSATSTVATMSGTWVAPTIDPPTASAQITDASQVKAWGYVTGGGGATLGQNYNIASVARNGAGDFTVTIDRDFTAATYAVVATVQDNGANLIWRVNGQAAGSFDIHFRGADTPFTLTDPDAFAFCCFGVLV